MDIKSKSFVVLGAGESGVQSALFLRKRGGRIFLSELKSRDECPDAARLLSEAGVECEFGRHTIDRIRHCDLIVISPGISPRTPIYRAIVQANIPLWSEIELASQFTSSEMIAVTGTNGKTTVTTLIRDILDAGGRSVRSCGNIGNPFIGEIDRLHRSTVVVVEVSSFQLKHVHAFRPHISVLLNLTDNHLDWHKDFNEYAQTKCRIFENQLEKDYAVVNENDPECLARTRKLRCGTVYFNDQEVENLDFAAAIKVGDLYGVDRATTERVIDNFSGLEHRFQDIGIFLGIRFINDSKSTTIASLSWALDRVDRNTILITGGRLKGGDFATLTKKVQSKIREVIALGESQEAIQGAFGKTVRVRTVQSLAEAVDTAKQVARNGETVLFSPACASFDMFRDYIDRGKQFINLVTGAHRKMVQGSNL